MIIHFWIIRKVSKLLNVMHMLIKSELTVVFRLLRDTFIFNLIKMRIKRIYDGAGKYAI